MHTIKRYVLAPTVAVAAAFVAVPVAHAAASSAAHSQISLAGPICPQGTNWDNILKTCR
ncbi:MAG TPA: hypothetical protein VFI65_09120 [Streptosporangiaceae bacterium]|nr:hypothetical protein [Streptosporangiaceae bacterium]